MEGTEAGRPGVDVTCFKCLERVTDQCEGTERDETCAGGADALFINASEKRTALFEPVSQIGITAGEGR